MLLDSKKGARKQSQYPLLPKSETVKDHCFECYTL